VIQPVRLEENIETAGSPKLSFAENYCNLCMECTQVCPTGALQPIRQAEALIGIAEVIHERCSAWNGGNCYFCVTRCPFQAIRRDRKGRPYVVSELCVGCGICEQACRLTTGAEFTKGILVFPAR
jgi:Fe-S-cluster-containing dehydrogenase component